MAYHGNRWRPDHCKCEILFWFDDELPQDEIVQHFEERQKDSQGNDIASKRCEAHNQHKETLYDVVLEENRRKNFILGKSQELHPDVVFTYEFDNNRHLHIKHEGKLSKKEEGEVLKKLQDRVDELKELKIEIHKDKFSIHG